MSKDTLYRQDSDGEPFRFDDAVAKVFPDMLRRSIPGYAASIEAIGSLAARYVTAGSNCYDLGCSLGAATLAMRQGAGSKTCHIVAADIAPAMVRRCQQIIATDSSDSAVTVEVIETDIRKLGIDNASMVVLNYTLQFLPAEQRDALLERIYAGMNDGAILVLSEKVCDESAHMESLLIDLHHEHKRRNDYSAMEIARKRAAIENVLLPETVAAHRQRIEAAGFKHFAVWLRYFNFVSMVAIR